MAVIWQFSKIQNESLTAQVRRQDGEDRQICWKSIKMKVNINNDEQLLISVSNEIMKFVSLPFPNSLIFINSTIF